MGNTNNAYSEGCSVMKVIKLSDAVAVGSAMSEEDFANAVTAGFKSIINNRTLVDKDLNLTPAEEAEFAVQHGLEYSHIPMNSGTVAPKAAEKLGAALDTMPKPILVHCAGATRSAKLWSLAQAGKGMDVDEILSVTTTAGFDFTDLRPLLLGIRDDAERAANN
jgi:uncharacterized protein (TIGR01244 family)